MEPVVLIAPVVLVTVAPRVSVKPPVSPAVLEIERLLASVPPMRVLPSSTGFGVIVFTAAGR